jgi:uncharacterized protein YndB with AHSA1/START domain
MTTAALTGQSPTRRGFLAKSVGLGTTVAFGSPFIAAPARAAGNRPFDGEMGRGPALQRLDGKERYMPDIMHSLKIHASPDQVYEAIATAEGLRNWWTRDAVLDSKLGGMGEFGFFGRRFVAKVKIEELQPPQRIEWKVTNAAWNGDTIVFEVRPEQAAARLSFSHRHFKEGDQRYASATTRWGFYLLSLKNYLETGKGSPNPDDADF